MDVNDSPTASVPDALIFEAEPACWKSRVQFDTDTS